MREYRSMYALAIPNSSLTAAEMLFAMWRCENSPMILAERSATSRKTFCASSGFTASCDASIGSPCASGGAEARHAVGIHAAVEPLRVEQVMHMSDRFAHGEKNLARIELAAEQHFEQVGGAFRRLCTRLDQRLEPLGVMRFERRDAHVRAAKRDPMRRQHQHILGQLAVAPDRIEKEPER